MRTRDDEEPTDHRAVRLNGTLAARWARRTVELLRRERGDINAINVFPVADGDTGSNLYLTVRAAYRAVEGLEGAVTLPQVLSAMATGALRGAHGNSGLILSVALRGAADSLRDIDVPDAADFAAALRLAAVRARDAVETPVDGTMVTVLDAMADEAQERAAAGDTLVELVGAVRMRSKEALRETTGQLPVLRENRVVDAGSTGIVELFDLLYAVVSGLDVDAGPDADGSAAAHRTQAGDALPGRERAGAPVAHASRAPGGTSRAAALPRPSGLELVAQLGGTKDRARALKRALARAGGTSIVVSWPMAHVHTRDGGGPAEAAELFAVMDAHTVLDLRVEDLATAHEHTDSAPGAGARGRGGLDDQDAEVAPPRLIALAESPALMLTLALSGAAAVRSVPHTVSGASGVEAAADRAATVTATVRALAAQSDGASFVLPDSPAMLTVLSRAFGAPAGQAPRRGEPHVLQARSAAGVRAAAAVFDPEAEVDCLREDLEEALAGTRSGTVVLAARTHAAGPLMYAHGDPLTYVEGRLRAVGADPALGVLDLVRRLRGSGGDLVTLIAGAAVPEATAEELRERAARAHPGAEVTLVRGGQDSSWMEVGVE